MTKIMWTTNGTMRKIKTQNQIEMLQFPGLNQDCNIFHLITTRQGGVSQGNYATMNPAVHVDDDPEAVRKNRELLCEALAIPEDHLVTPTQVHEDQIRIVSGDYLEFTPGMRKDYLAGVDALITNMPKICMGVSTADCVPILLWDPQNKVAAAAHVGWRGTVKQIGVKTVHRMVELFGCHPGHIRAAIGPCIGEKAFEVGDEVVKAFEEIGYSLQEMGSRNPETGKAHIDLQKANQLQLQGIGILPQHIEVAGMCTWENQEELFSARRLGIQSGRILSAIMIKK